MKIFIPIKEHSQRVPDKNFRIFGGVPLWEYTIKKYVGLNVEIFIDTDSPKLLKDIPKLYPGVCIYSRSRELLGDLVSVNKLIDFFLHNFNINTDEPIAQIHVTTPFLKPQILLAAANRMGDYYDSVVSCDKVQVRMWRPEFREDRIKFIPVNHNPLCLEPTQDLTPLYAENSAYYIFTKKSFEACNKRVGINPYFDVTDKDETMDIDTEEDWKTCLARL